jgi:Ca2+-binding RTX toxin-like protein
MNPSRGSEASTNASLTVFGHLESISNATKQAAERVVAILNEQGATIDLSAYGLANTSVSARENATIITGNGNASVGALDHAIVWSGSGNDYADVQNYATVHSGAGNDVVRAYHYSNIDAGDGDDWVSAYDHAVVDGGAGDDEIRTYEDSAIDAGDGDDFVVTLGNSTINGGTGNDTLVVTNNRSSVHSTFDNATVDGGDGDDYIQVNGNSTVSGGTGSDTIRLIGDGNTVIFNKGDGQDEIGIGRGSANTEDNATIKVAGYSADDVTLTQDTGVITVSFKNSNDSLTLKFRYNASATLEFEDGTALELVPSGFTQVQQMDVFVDALTRQETAALFYR